MNNMNTINPSVSFKGLIVNGTVPNKSVKKLGEFASHIENVNFIKDLEKFYGVDAVLNGDITQMSFSHQKYGNLSEKYGCRYYQLENVFRDVSIIIKDIKSAIKKAAKDFEKNMAEKELTQRGC